MAKELRTRISELPLCEDINELDTLIGIGVDGKTYRVNKNTIIPEEEKENTKWETFNFYVERYEENIVAILTSDETNRFYEYFDHGGIMHAIVYDDNDYTWLDIKAVIGSSISVLNVVSGDSYYDMNMYYPVNYSGDILKAHLSISDESNNYDENIVVLSLLTLDPENGQYTDLVSNFDVIGIYFEPVDGLNRVYE